MLMFVFCCVFASLIFEACGETADFVPVGVSMHTITVFVVGGLTALMSSLPCSIAGPDVNPALFFAIIAEKIVKGTDGQCSATSHGSDSDGAEHRRFLAAASGTNSTSFGHSEEAAATIIFTIMMCTLILAVTFFVLGYFNATRVVQFVPSCVLSGFLAVVGYKIMLKAIDAATGAHISLELNHIVISPIWTGDFWAKLSPAVPLGVTIYYLKKNHIGNPLVMLPTLLGVPLFVFYIVILVANGGDLAAGIDKAREDGWYYKEFKQKPFYEGFNTVYGNNFENVRFDKIPEVIPDIVIMVLIVVIDALLKLAGTRKKLEYFDLNFNEEMLVAGTNNFINFFVLGAPGYSQLKFNLLNAGISSTVKSKIPGLLCAGINGILYFSGFMAINYMPRFWLGALVIYAGLGFLDDNLIGVYGHMTWQEYTAVWVVLLVGVFDTLAIAMGLGFVFALLIFVIDYSGRGVVHSQKRGTQHKSSVVRAFRERERLLHLGKLWCVVELKRFLFFASVYEVQDIVANIIKRTQTTADETQVPRDYIRRLAVYKAGEKVRVQRNNMWVDAYVVAYDSRSCEYQIEYEDTGKKLDHVVHENIRERHSTVFFRGEKVRARFNKGTQWYSGKVVEYHPPTDTVGDGTYDIEYDESIPRKYMTLITAPVGVFKGYRYIVLDFTHVDGVDFTGASVFLEIAKMCRKADLKLIFSGIQENTQMYTLLENEGVFEYINCLHETVSMAVEFVEDSLLAVAADVRRNWLLFEPLKKYHFTHVQKTSYEAFEEAFGGDLGSMLSTYTEQIRLNEGDVLIEAGHDSANLYLIQSGRLGAWIFPNRKIAHEESHGVNTESSKETDSLLHQNSLTGVRNTIRDHKGRRVRVRTYTRGAFVNEHVLAGQYFSPHVIVADHESVVLKISPKNLRKMELDSPNTFKQMLRTVLYTESLIRHSLEAEEEHAQFNTMQHKKQIEKMRKLQDAENFKRMWQTPFTVLKKNMESLIKKKQIEREKHLLEKHKDDAIRAGQSSPAGDRLSGALVALRGRKSSTSSEFKKGDHVRIIKVGSQTGRTATVTDPSWHNRVKVLMDGTKDSIKSYRVHELELIVAKMKFSLGDIVKVVKKGSQFNKLARVEDPAWSGRVKVEMLDDQKAIKSYLETELVSMSDGKDDMSKIQVGDRVKVVKEGSSKYGTLCIVTDPNWSGRVKVIVESNGTEKSYKATELVVVTKAKYVVRKTKHFVVKLILPNHVRKAARVCFNKQLRHERSRVMHIKRASSIGIPNSGPVMMNSPRSVQVFHKQMLPLSAVRDTIISMGIYPDRHEIEHTMMAVVGAATKKRTESKESQDELLGEEEGVTFDIFEEILKEITLKSMGRDEIKSLKTLFDVLNGGKPLKKADMVKLLVQSDVDKDGDVSLENESGEVLGIVESLFDRWTTTVDEKSGERVLTLDEFCSMISYHGKLEELIYDVRASFRRWLDPEAHYFKTKSSGDDEDDDDEDDTKENTTLSTDNENTPEHKTRTIHAMHRTASDLSRGVHRRAGRIIREEKNKKNASKQRPSLLQTFSLSHKTPAKQKLGGNKYPDITMTSGKSESEMKNKQIESRRGHLAALRSRSDRIQSVAQFNLISQRTMEEAIANNGTQILDDAARALNEDNIAETLWLFGSTLSNHALKWCLTDECWKLQFLDLVGNEIVVHDYAFAQSVSSIHLDRSVRIYHRVDEIKAISTRLGVELPSQIPPEFRDKYSEKNLIFLHHPKAGEEKEKKIMLIIESHAAELWNKAIVSASNDEHFDEEQIRDVDKIREMAKDMLWEADTDGDGCISFKEMMLTVTLVHEDETDTVLRNEETELLQEKLTYLDPWMKASSAPSGNSTIVTKEERKAVSKKTFEPIPPSPSHAPSTPQQQKTSVQSSTKVEEENTPGPPSQPTSPTKKTKKEKEEEGDTKEKDNGSSGSDSSSSAHTSS